jgi:hypothetical protein
MLRNTVSLLALSALFLPLAANARGVVTPTSPTLQLVQVSGPTSASRFAPGRAAELPGYHSRINGGRVVYALTDANVVEDAALSGSVYAN